MGIGVEVVLLLGPVGDHQPPRRHTHAARVGSLDRRGELLPAQGPAGVAVDQPNEKPPVQQDRLLESQIPEPDGKHEDQIRQS